MRLNLGLRVKTGRALMRVRLFFYTRWFGMDIGKSVRIATGVTLDKTNPCGIHIGDGSYLTQGVMVLSHDHVRRYLMADTHIEKRCFLGVRSIIMPGITLGNEVVVGAGAVVTRDIPSHSIVAGNPARVVQTGVGISAGARLFAERDLQVVLANNYTYMRGGSERVMMDEAENLRALGHHVSLFGRLDALNPVDLPNRDLMPPIIDPQTQRSIGKLRAALNIIYNRDTRRRFLTFCSRLNPDVVHAHNIYAGLTTSVIDACRERRIPCIITLHDYKLACPSYLMLDHGRICERCSGGCFMHCLIAACHKNNRVASLVSTLESYFNRLLSKYMQAHYLITPSHFLLNKMLTHGVPREKLLCIPNGLDPSQYLPSYEDQGYILFVGRLSREKGIGTLIAAIKNDRIHLRIAGTGPEMERLRTERAQTGQARISFEGHLTGTALQDLMRKAMFIVVPSEWYENASMTVLEAMAYGKPIVASRIGGIPEQVVDGETGLLVSHGNAEEFRAAIMTLVNDKQRRIQMGKAARARLESRFSLRRHSEALLKVYLAAIRNEPLTQTDLDSQE